MLSNETLVERSGSEPGIIAQDVYRDAGAFSPARRDSRDASASSSDPQLGQRPERGALRPVVKRAFDIIASLGAITFFSPLFLALFLIVRSDGGPGIFAQNRIGRDGRLFRCYKFRSMEMGAEAKLQRVLETNPNLRREWEQNRKLTNDPRVTKFGAFLRKKSLDELPQLFNVLKGDMSIVGPRPIVESERALYGPAIERYEAVRPGLTGLWQVSGRSLCRYDRRVALDIQYVDNWSLKFDVSIIIRTFGVLLSGVGSY